MSSTVPTKRQSTNFKVEIFVDNDKDNTLLKFYTYKYFHKT